MTKNKKNPVLDQLIRAQRDHGGVTMNEHEIEPMTVAELIQKLSQRKGKAKVLLHLSDGKRVVKGELVDLPPDFGVGDDPLNVVFLHGGITQEYPNGHRPGWRRQGQGYLPLRGRDREVVLAALQGYWPEEVECEGDSELRCYIAELCAEGGLTDSLSEQSLRIIAFALRHRLDQGLDEEECRRLGERVEALGEAVKP
jgi:hypothetical protein